MDGTIYLSETWIDGAREFLEKIEETGRTYVFLTNNSSKSAAAYVQKLDRMGLTVDKEKIVTSGEATVYYLKKQYRNKRIFLLGNAVLCEEFENAGIVLSDSNPEIVVTAFDTSLTYEKLCKVCDYVRVGLPYIAPHPDFNCPTDTVFIPDIGSFHALIHASTGRYPDEIIGKPYHGIINYLLSRTGTSSGETAIIGDRLYTDIKAGKNNGLTSILVLSGETSIQDLQASEIKPDLIFPSVKDLIPLL